MTDLAADVLASWRRILTTQKHTAEAALAQVPDHLLHQRPASNINSIAIIIRHVSGNMLSRWTNFLTTDGEKPWRDREREFIDGSETREELMALWERAWAAALGAIDSLTPEDLARTVTIRSEPHTVPDAVNRQISHYGYHTGQIMLVARLLMGDERWNWVTVPPGGSGRFNQEMESRFGRGPAEGEPGARAERRPPGTPPDTAP